MHTYWQLTQACRDADVARQRTCGKDWTEDLQEREERRTQEQDRRPGRGRSRQQGLARRQGPRSLIDLSYHGQYALDYETTDRWSSGAGRGVTRGRHCEC